MNTIRPSELVDVFIQRTGFVFYRTLLLPRAREARTRGRVIGVSVGCLFVCVFVDTKTSSLSETGQFMSSTYYVPVRNRKILASTYLTNESVRQGAEKSRLKIFLALLKPLFNIVDPCQKNDYYQSGRS